MHCQPIHPYTVAGMKEHSQKCLSKGLNYNTHFSPPVTHEVTTFAGLCQSYISEYVTISQSQVTSRDIPVAACSLELFRSLWSWLGSVDLWSWATWPTKANLLARHRFGLSHYPVTCTCTCVCITLLLWPNGTELVFDDIVTTEDHFVKMGDPDIED